MLQAAAQRGVRVNIIVYKEVTQALTRKYPFYMSILLTAVSADQVLLVSSSHTKHHLEDLHPNIAVFRHPDHLPDRDNIEASITESLQNLTLNAAGLSSLSGDALKGIYGMNDDVILYWAHHEKLCIVDNTAFMGGLDLCFGRWDTNQHAIADVHPTDLNEIVFPGQDYNNNRVLDFQDVAHWENNQLDRKATPRMGWSDVALSMHGPVVEDLRRHFVERWNFIYDTKYEARNDSRYSRLALHGRPSSSTGQGPAGSYQRPSSSQGGSQHPPPQSNPHGQYQPAAYGGQTGGQQFPPPPPGPPPQSSQVPYFPPPPTQESHSSHRGLDDYNDGGESKRGFGLERGRDWSALRGQLASQVHHYQDRYLSGYGRHQQARPTGSISCQIVRSCAKWSHGVPTEHSIADAYAAIIRDSQHFVYIENQFFITATGDEQKPVKNKIGAAIVERILRAARAGEKWKMIVVIPSVPCFPGDLMDESTLGTRAIMEFQYNSINRGGHSIMELVAKEGYNPMDYIRFYNLRNYDRINVSGAMLQAERGSGVDYEEARKEHDVTTGGYGGYGPGAPKSAFDTTAPYEQYQRSAQQVKPSAGGRWDTVSECYMLGGEDIRNVPWDGPPEAEIDAFVSEELYVHSKVCRQSMVPVRQTIS